LTVDGFGKRNVAITAQLNVVAPGAYIEAGHGKITGDLGTAAVGIKWYAYEDEIGYHHVENDYFVPHAIIRNCVGFQLTLAYRRIWTGQPEQFYTLMTNQKNQEYENWNS
jgi:hypothetical protein